MTIQRGQADVMIAGATGTRVHPLRSIHVSLQEQLAGNKQERECNSLSRPFDADRDGQVLGEGAAAIILETREHAEARGATVYGEILGFASSCTGQGDRETALANVMRQALTSSDLAKSDLGHIHAHGLSCIATDRSEAAAIQRSVWRGPPAGNRGEESIWKPRLRWRHGRTDRECAGNASGTLTRGPEFHHAGSSQPFDGQPLPPIARPAKRFLTRASRHRVKPARLSRVFKRM